MAQRITTPGTISVRDQFVIIDPVGQQIDVYLPVAEGNDNLTFVIKVAPTSTATIRLYPPQGGDIDKNTVPLTMLGGECLTVRSDNGSFAVNGFGWLIVSRYTP